MKFSVKVTIHFHLVPRVRELAAIPPFPYRRGASLSTRYVSRARYLVKHRDSYTLPLPKDVINILIMEVK
jgi:hypothetical protein